MRIPLCLALALAWPAAASRPEGVRFDLSVAGVPVGGATLAVSRSGDRYVALGSADVGFLFWGGQGGAEVEGAATADGLRPARYRLAYEGVTRPGTVAIDFEGGSAVRWERQPPIPPQYAEGRVEVEPRHLSGALDPLSALIAPDAPPEALCDRALPVFSGYTRFDLVLDGVAAVEDGVVTCTARYVPVAGHRPDSNGVRRMTRPDALSVALSPIGDGLWGPHRVAVATRFGTFLAERAP